MGERLYGLGLGIGVGLLLAGLGIIAFDRSAISECAKKHNVYACELVAVPVQSGDVR